MIQKEAMRQDKRRMPTDHPPCKLGTQSTLVNGNPHREHLASLRIMDFTILPKELAKDKLHASFLLRNKIFMHNYKALVLQECLPASCCTLQQKTQSTGLWGKSFGRTYGKVVYDKRLHLIAMTSILFRAANIRQNIESCSFR